MVGLTPSPLMIGSAMTSKPIYFDSIDNCAYILGDKWRMQISA